MKNIYKAPRGTLDILPNETKIWQKVILRNIFRNRALMSKYSIYRRYYKKGIPLFCGMPLSFPL